MQIAGLDQQEQHRPGREPSGPFAQGLRWIGLESPGLSGVDSITLRDTRSVVLHRIGVNGR
jgi:hypothetical protein